MKHQLTCAGRDLRCTLTRQSQDVVADVDVAGRRWGPAPLLRLDVYHKYLRRTEVSPRYDVLEFHEAGGPLHVVLADPATKTQVGLWLVVVDDELQVTLQLAEVYENDPALFRVFAVDVLPGLLRVGGDGTLLLPVASGMACRPHGKPALADRFMIYGEQERWELLPTLPFCAAHTPDGGMMVLATQGAEDAQCRVSTDGRGGGAVGLAMSLRQQWPDPVDHQTRVLRYVPLAPAAVPAQACAQRIRQHVVEDLGKPTLTQRMKESPGVAALDHGYLMKVFCAVETGVGTIRRRPGNAVPPSPTSFDCVTTFDEARDGLSRLHQRGIDRLTVQMVGWNPRGHDGMYPTRLPIDLRLGGEAGFVNLLRHGQSLGYRVTVHDNYSDAYRVSPDWDPEVVIHDIHGEPLIIGLWGGGIMYRQWPLAFTARHLDQPLQRMRELGLRDFYYVDAMGVPLEVNHHPRHRGPRGDHARGIRRILQATRAAFGAVATETGYLYACLDSDVISASFFGYDLGRLRHWPIVQLCDEHVPVLHLALQGLVLFEGHGLAWTDTMRKVLLGLIPRVEWCAHDVGLRPVLDEAMIEAVACDWQVAAKRFGHLTTQRLLAYESLGPDAARSVFEDGTEVVADFAAQSLVVNGEPVQPPGATPEPTLLAGRA